MRTSFLTFAACFAMAAAMSTKKSEVPDYCLDNIAKCQLGPVIPPCPEPCGYGYSCVLGACEIDPAYHCPQGCDPNEMCFAGICQPHMDRRANEQLVRREVCQEDKDCTEGSPHDDWCNKATGFCDIWPINH